MKKFSMYIMLWFYRAYFNLLFIIVPKYAASQAVKLFSTPVGKKIRSRELKVLNKAKEEILDYDGLKMHVYEWGSGERTAMLVHGWAGNAGSLGAFVQPLVREGYRVIAFDGPAHGKSEGKQTNIFHFSKFMISLFESYKPEILITHSFGSAVSVFALSQEKNNTIKRMVMLTTPDRFEDIIIDFTKLMNINTRNRNKMYRYLKVRFGRDVHEMQVSKTIHELGSTDILVMHSRSDRVLDFSNAVSVTDNSSNTKLVALDKIGHYRMLWNEEVINKAMDFINKNEKVKST